MKTTRTEGTDVEYYVYDGQQVVADLDGGGNLLRTYVWGQGIDNLLSFTDHTTTNTYYAIKDHQNTVLALVDETGSVVESYDYDALGRTTIYSATGTQLEESAAGNRYCFQGREYDATTGLYYFRARWYNPVVGKWLSKDPIGISGGLNLYVFCENNPVNFIDPDGLKGSYSTQQEASFAASRYYHERTQETGREAGGIVFRGLEKKSGKIRYGFTSIDGGKYSVKAVATAPIILNKGYDILEVGHSHPPLENSEHVSKDDYEILATAEWFIKEYGKPHRDVIGVLTTPTQIIRYNRACPN